MQYCFNGDGVTMVDGDKGWIAGGEEKNLAFGRHWISRPMRIVSPLQWREKKT